MTVSPPFALAETLPGDSDTVSQFPALERTFRDTVESWLLINHNTQGRHAAVQFDHRNAGMTGVALVTQVYADDDDGQLFAQIGASGNPFPVGVPTGTVLEWYTDTLPEGYAWANAGTISRTGVGARLFALWGTKYGIGNGTTTFNVLDKRGRMGVGKETMGGATTSSRVTTAGSGVDGTTLDAVGGNQLLTSHYHDVFLYDPGHAHTGYLAGISLAKADAAAGGSIMGTIALNHAIVIDANFTGMSVRNATGGGGTADRTALKGSGSSENMPPVIVCNFIIKL